MIGQSIDFAEGFLTERNADCISEESKFSVQSRVMLGSGHS
jgi:hypothetical protein